MFVARVTAEPGAAPDPHDQGANKRGQLLGLVRKLLTFGRDLVSSLQRQNTPMPRKQVARRFGTFNLALIIARLTRGLAIAARLESRLLRPCPAQNPPRANPDRPTQPTKPRATRPPPLSPSEDDAALLRGLPSAKEIAERVRGRPVGAVIVEICRDLGIDASHELWPDIRDAIIQNGGNLVRMLNIWTGHIPGLLAGLSDYANAPLSPAWGGPLVASTGPP